MRLPTATVMLALLPALVSAGDGAAADDVDPAVGGAALHPAAADPSASGIGRDTDELDLDRTEITGNQELPKVLYIVPWKTSDLGDLVGRPVNSLLDEVLAPVDREVFTRHVGYYEDLNTGRESARVADSE